MDDGEANLGTEKFDLKYVGAVDNRFEPVAHPGLHTGVEFHYYPYGTKL